MYLLEDLIALLQPVKHGDFNEGELDGRDLGPASASVSGRHEGEHLYQVFQVLELGIRLREEPLLVLASAQCKEGAVFLAGSELRLRDLVFSVEHALDLPGIYEHGVS